MLTVSGDADGIDSETFGKLADDAKAACPVSKALTGTEIALNASFG